MRKRADGIVPLCDLAVREKTSLPAVVEELLQGWPEGTHKLEGCWSGRPANRAARQTTEASLTAHGQTTVSAAIHKMLALCKRE